MNDKRCHVELSKAPTPEQVQQVEDRLNLYIRRNYPVHVTFTETRPPTMPKGKKKKMSLSVIDSTHSYHNRLKLNMTRSLF